MSMNNPTKKIFGPYSYQKIPRYPDPTSTHFLTEILMVDKLIKTYNYGHALPTHVQL